MTHKANLHDLLSPLQIRASFAEIVQKVDKNSQSIFNDFYE